jgi:hypothetical protein
MWNKKIYYKINLIHLFGGNMKTKCKFLAIVIILTTLAFFACDAVGGNESDSDKPSYENGTLSVIISGLQIPEEYDYLRIGVFPVGTTVFTPYVPNEGIVRIDNTDSNGDGSGISTNGYGNVITLTGGTHYIAGGVWKDSICLHQLTPVRTIIIDGSTTINLTADDFQIGTSAISGIINIDSVSPSNDLVDATLTDFTVNVSYTLDGTAQGELNIGFNNFDAINQYLLILDASVIISEGTGTHTFNVDALTKDWGADGNFKVYVDISNYPHESTWVPLNLDTEILTFE